MRILLLLAVVWLLALLPAGGASALSFRVVSEGEETVVVAGEGPIGRGASAAFREVLRRHAGREVILALSSGGGLVREAVETGVLIARFRIAVVVPSGATCASACFFLLAASPTRLVDPTARIGVHSVSLDGEEGMDTLAITTLMARLADEYRIPASVVGRMVVTPPERMAWLDRREIEALPARLTDLPALPARPTAWEPSARGEPWPDGAGRSAGRPPPVPVLRAEPPAAPSARRETSPPRVEEIPTPARPASRDPLEVPRAQIEGESRAFADGLRDRTAWEAWIRTLPPSALAGAIFWVGQRSLPAPQGCGSMDAVFRRACEEARVLLDPSDRRRLSEPDYRRGWNAFLHPAYRASVLEAMAECRDRGGRASLNRGFEQVRDLNGDGVDDYVIDYEALVCSAGLLRSCPSGACRLEIHLSAPGGVHRLAFGAPVRGWLLRPDPPAHLEVEPASCPGRGLCRETLRVSGDRILPGLR